MYIIENTRPQQTDMDNHWLFTMVGLLVLGLPDQTFVFAMSWFFFGVLSETFGVTPPGETFWSV